MKKQYFINANIIDPHNSINENGGLIIGEDGKIEAIGKKVNTNNLPTRLFLRIEICMSLASGTVDVLYTLLITLAALLGRKWTPNSLRNLDPFIRCGQLL